MEKVEALISQHKKASLLTLFTLTIFIDFSATSAMNATRQRAVEEAAKTESADEQGTSDNGKDAEEKAKFSSSREKLIDGYDDETKRLIEALNVSVFSVNNGRNTLRFHDDYYVETVSGKEQNHPYTTSTVELGNNGSDGEIDHIVFETDTSIRIAISTLIINADNASANEYVVASTSMFELADMSYERRDAVKEINVTGFSSEITKLLGDTDEIKKQLNDRRSIHFPVATTTTWIGTCNIDYNKDTISTAFTIGDSNSSGATGNTGASVSVTYSRSEKKCSFSM